MSGEAQNPGGSGLVLGRAESSLSQPELQEFMNLQACEKRGRKRPTTQNKTETHHIPPVSSDPKRNVQFQQSKKQWDGTELTLREKEQKADRDLF